MTRRQTADGPAELAAQSEAQKLVWELQRQLDTAQDVVKVTPPSDPAYAKRLAARDALFDEFIDAKRALNASHEAAVQASLRGDGRGYDAAVSARAALLERARRILPELRTDSMGDRAIHEACLAKLGSKLDLSKRSDDYVRGYFQQLTSGRTDSAQPPPAEPQQPARARAPLWTEPLRASRDRLGVTGPVVVREDAARIPWRTPLHASSSGAGRVLVRE
jgi:hypothetical protein